MKKKALSLLILVALLSGCWIWRQGPPRPVATDTLLGMLSDENTAGYAVATEPGAVQFPRDLGPHPDYQTEWWYYTGNLATADGRLFGYQLTFFRRALAPPGQAGVADASSWRTAQIYGAHFAISDIASRAFHSAEKFSRDAMALAGASAQPYGVWVEDWYVRETGNKSVRLFAQTDNTRLDLNVTQTLPPILQGNDGLSVKSDQRGNASYYYSLVREQTQGTVTIDGQSFAVTGLSWKDHEYSTSAMGPDDVGWDWFALQFDNGSSLMICVIRKADGRISQFSNGNYIASDGIVTRLALSDWRATATDHWTSDGSGATYPIGWKIEIDRLGLTLSAKALMPNQELRLSTTYWEGAVGVEGRHHAAAIRGQGYVELTGYARSLQRNPG